MKSSIQCLEEIIRALTALHLKLVHHRSAGKTAIGGAPVDELIKEIDFGLSSYERMLARFKNEIAAEAMASTKVDAE